MISLLESDKFNASNYFHLLELGKDEASARSSRGEKRDKTSKFKPGTVNGGVIYYKTFSLFVRCFWLIF